MKRAIAIAITIALGGCASKTPLPAEISAKVVQIAQGTEVKLLLAKNLRAGEAQKGDIVPFLVAEDVTIDGSVAIPKGTPVQGEVTWSRSEGTLSGLMNQPARLEVALHELQLDGGTKLTIAGDAEKPDESYAFTRDNTGAPKIDDAKVEDLLKSELNRQAMEKVSELFDGKEVSLTDDDAKKALTEIADSLNLGDTKKLLEGGQGNWSTIDSTVHKLQSGDISSLARGDLSLGLNAVMELANLAGGLGDKFVRSIKGRTIHAYAGTIVTVKTTSGGTVTVR